MTKLQRREHKLGNQERKLALIERVKSRDKSVRNPWHNWGVCQNGKLTGNAIATRDATKDVEKEVEKNNN